MSYFLSVCIPTYNGGENLKYNVNKLIKMQPEFGFEVCVSDNASDDGTQEFMKNIIDKYDFVKYNRNEENFGFAYNFDYVLNMANGEYRWLLGDDDEIVEENLGKVISCLKEYKPDICVVNGGRYTNSLRVKGLKSKVFNNKNDVLGIIGEHMSWISCLIFNSIILKELNISGIKDNAFPHLIEVLKYLNLKCNLLWMCDNCVMIQQNCQDRYSKKYLEYFIRDWVNITQRIGNYDKKSIIYFIKKQEMRTLSWMTLLSLRSRNIINTDNINACKPQIYSLQKKKYIFMQAINCIPVTFFVGLHWFYKKLKMKEQQ